jgi:hypothetical protein
MMDHFIVVPAKAGTHDHGIALLIAIMPQAKATTSVLTNICRGVRIPAFAGTTG